MPKDRKIAVNEEFNEFRYETERLLHRTAKLLAEVTEMHKRSEEAHSKRMAELGAVLKKMLPEARLGVRISTRWRIRFAATR